MTMVLFVGTTHTCQHYCISLIIGGVLTILLIRKNGSVMNFIWFERHEHTLCKVESISKKLHENGFDGVMFPYSMHSDDYFIKISRIVDKIDIKYIVAIRPYSISPEYLLKICKSINEIQDGKIIINFISGWVNNETVNSDYILSDVNNSSSNIERSNYMMKYTKAFNNIKPKNVDFYVSTTSIEVHSFCKENNFKMIIPYSYYKNNKFKLSDEQYIISIAPIIREGSHKEDLVNMDADVFTEKEFLNFLQDCKIKNVEGILMCEDKADEEYTILAKSIMSYR